MSSQARRARTVGAAGLVLLIAGVVALIIGWRGQQHAPTPPASAASPVAVVPTLPAPSRASRTSAGSAASAGDRVVARSAPVHLEIPAIGVSSTVQQLGLASDGSVQVPPLGRDSHAGWYKYSPAPGQIGPSILLGHIDSAKYGPGVFFRLGDLRQRDRIMITLADHTVVVFEIERVVEYPKAHFPTLQVYGNLDHPGLRLITCGGRFDPSAHSYEDNIVVYASMVSTHPVTAHP